MASSKSVFVLIFWTFTLCFFHVSAQGVEFPATIGSPCTTDDRCIRHIDNSVCRELKCTCESQFVPSSTNVTLCLPVATNVNDHCEEPIQCTHTMGDKATCTEQKCVCLPENHYVTPIQCLLNRGLGDNCTEKSECYLEADGMNQNIDCDDKKQCSCRTGYEPTPDKKSCKSSGVANIISITCLVGVWILHMGV